MSQRIQRKNVEFRGDDGPSGNPVTDAGEPMQASGVTASTAAPLRPHQRRRLGPFSSLTRRIVALNVVALAILVGGVLYLNQFRMGLIDARIEALTVQAEIIASAIAQAGTPGPAATRVNPVLGAQVLRRLVVPTQTRARLFNQRGRLVADSRALLATEPVISRPLDEPGGFVLAEWIEGIYAFIFGLLPGAEMPLYRESTMARAQEYGEVVDALRGRATSAVRVNSDGNLIVSVAVPVQRFKVVLGALMLSTEAGDIDQIVRAERLAIIEVFLVALSVTVVLSLMLAGTIARPIHRLAEAADRVRSFRSGRSAIPDFSNRSDEIGDLSGAMRDMTNALYQRIDAIERFAADVAHEIKNPLTSLRSAVETLSRANAPEQRDKLLAIIMDDVGRLDRLISDISNASRVDAELSRGETVPVDTAALVEGLLFVIEESMDRTQGAQRPRVHVSIDELSARRGGLLVDANETRLSQVFRNLIDNALSFSPPGGLVTVSVARHGGDVVFTIEDEGPGIPEANLDSIFERFYTERPEGEAFGSHSGLGLSIARQIVEAYGGSIRAENRREDRPTGSGRILGARFVVSLPAAVSK